MTLLTAAHLMDRYGALLTVEQLSEVIRLEKRTIANKMSARTLGIPVCKQGRVPLFRAVDVAAYIDGLKAEQ